MRVMMQKKIMCVCVYKNANRESDSIVERGERKRDTFTTTTFSFLLSL